VWAAAPSNFHSQLSKRQPPTFAGCRFDNCEWKFEGAAAHTLQHLKTIWGAGAKAAVQGMIKDITGAAR